MTFTGAARHDDPGIAHPERLARMAEADNFLPGLAESCRKRHRRQMIAAWLAVLGAAAALGWIASDALVLLLLDEGRLAAVGIGP